MVRKTDRKTTLGRALVQGDKSWAVWWETRLGQGTWVGRLGVQAGRKSGEKSVPSLGKRFRMGLA